MLIRYHLDAPETLHVVVTRDGDELASEDFTPEYEEVVLDPNACGGPCNAAQISVAF